MQLHSVEKVLWLRTLPCQIPARRNLKLVPIAVFFLFFFFSFGMNPFVHQAAKALNWSAISTSLPIFAYKIFESFMHLGGADQGLSSSVTSPLTFQLYPHNASQTSTLFMAGRNGSSRKIKSLVREKWLSFISAKVSEALKPLIAEPSHSTS